MKSKNYEDFVEKFKPKKTTDDCYTPSLVYEAISDWVANEYNLDKSTFLPSVLSRRRLRKLRLFGKNSC